MDTRQSEDVASDYSYASVPIVSLSRNAFLADIRDHN